MKFLVFKNANGLGLTSDLVINWTSVKYIRPFSSSVFFLELNNNSQIKFTVNAGNSGDVIKAINSAITSSPASRIIYINPKSIGAFSFSSIKYLEGGKFIENDHTVYVSADGTEVENGQALLDGYEEAVEKIETVTSAKSFGVSFSVTSFQNTYELYLSGSGIGAGVAVTNTPYNFSMDLGSVFLDGVDSISGVQNYTFEITAIGSPSSNRMTFVITLNGRRVEGYSAIGNNVAVLQTSKTASTLIVGPGVYDLPSDLIINDIVSMISLAGTCATIIKGSNVEVKSLANNTNTPSIFQGFEILTNIYVDSNLSVTTFEDIYVRNGFQAGSFQPRTGVGTASSVYKNCYASEAFGRGTGASCSGTFIECWGYKSFGGNGGNTSGVFYRCGYDNSISGTSNDMPYRNGEYQFGYQGAEFSGQCLYCIGDYYSFASRMETGTITSNAKFSHCTLVGYQGFAARTLNNSGKFHNCVSYGSASYSWEIPNGGDHSGAVYMNCTAQSNFAFGTPKSSGGGSFTGRFINCTALGTNNFGRRPTGTSETTGLLYNCYSNDGFEAVSGAGKVRNSLDNTTFTIINLG